MPTLQWVGKDKVVNHHHDVPLRLLKQEYTFVANAGAPANSTGNRIVHGDNLEVLKSLLPEFEGKVNCIYIDPPYNTGNESWVYNDNVNDPKIKKWLGQVVGKEGEDLSRHDKWLCMMYPRLKLLHRLLAHDGVMLMSLDSNEHRYAEVMLDEIFGAPNRIETVVWKKSYGGGSKAKHIVNLHEYVICFAKDKSKIGVIELPPSDEVLKYYKFKDSKFDLRGPYRLQPLATNSMDERPNLRYPIVHKGEEIWPEKQWQWSSERVLSAYANDEIDVKKIKGRWSVNYKQYLRDEDGEDRGSKLYSIVDSVYTQHGTNEVKLMFGDGKTFDFPKPSDLIAKFLQGFTESDSLVLDSFAGSGTTAHAVLKLNAQDGGNRRFILCEMMDYAETITAERVRRVINGYGEGSKAVPGTGGGFDFYTVGPALFNADKTLNEDVGEAAIRHYVAYTENIPAAARCVHLQGTDAAHIAQQVTPHALGVTDTALWVFYYEQHRVTTLDLDFLGTLNIKALLQAGKPRPAQFVVYADKCALDHDFLRQYSITFKRIPRDITRF